MVYVVHDLRELSDTNIEFWVRSRVSLDHIIMQRDTVSIRFESRKMRTTQHNEIWMVEWFDTVVKSVRAFDHNIGTNIIDRTDAG